MRIYFGIDCAPGTPRPDVRAKSVFERLGVEPIEPYNKFFGAWQWNVQVADDFDFENFSAWIKEYTEWLYEEGLIRGAEWCELYSPEAKLQKLIMDAYGLDENSTNDIYNSIVNYAGENHVIQYMEDVVQFSDYDEDEAPMYLCHMIITKDENPTFISSCYQETSNIPPKDYLSIVEEKCKFKTQTVL